MHTVATHSGSFHADDVFAMAAFQLLLGKENVEVVRTRDVTVLSEADYVVDVGGEYNHEQKRYDHHQLGAPVRENGVPYAGFGLMWRHYGSDICDSEEIAEAIEERICLPIDAGDNGVSLYELNELGVQPFELYGFVSLFGPAWDSGESKDEAFLQAVDWARSVIIRMIKKERAKLKMSAYIKEVYESSENRQRLVFDKPVPHVALIEYTEVELIICPDDPDNNDNWTATCIRKAYDSFDIRVSFPKEWSGLREEELARVSGIPDAVFCHKACFVFVAGSKESALRAAELAE